MPSHKTQYLDAPTDNGKSRRPVVMADRENSRYG